MKSVIVSIFTLFIIINTSILNAQDLSPYIQVATTSQSISEATSSVKSALEEKGFDIIGSYNPENNKKLFVIIYSRQDLQSTTLKVEDRGALAGALKVGLVNDGTSTTISYINPEYIFNAYLGKSYDSHKSVLQKIESDVSSAMAALGNENKPFGGSISAKDLRKYQYKMMMPYFSDPVELKTFSSFEEGVATIEKNLSAKKGNTELIYKLKFKNNKVAVYGIGLLDKSIGEAEFLPIIGESHIAAMPYEIILQGNKATILHGRYRIALHWPELTMSTFMKIMSTPGNIEDTMKNLCQ